MKYLGKVSLKIWVISSELIQALYCTLFSSGDLASSFVSTVLLELLLKVLKINIAERIIKKIVPNAIYLDVELFSDDLGYKLEQAGLGKLTNLTKHSGYMAFPIFIFDEEILRKADSRIYSKYIDNFEENSIKAIINL